MTDLSSAIVPKSDQLNADDLLTGPRTIKVTKVTKRAGEQPISVHYEDDEGKPWKPCKSMCRVLVSLWGANGDEFAGRSLTLFTDPGVKWAGMEVGGIRISHMSHIETDTVLPLTVTKGKREPYRVKVLKVQEQKPDLPPGDLTKALAMFDNTATGEDRKNILKGLRAKFTWTDDEGKAIVAKITEMGKADRAQKTSTEPKNEDELP